MKYRKIYEALERRWKVSPGFRFTDFSGWRNPARSDAGYRPLWIIVEDKLGNHRIWINQVGRELSITYQKMDDKGVCYGDSMRIRCRDQRHMAQELDTLYAGVSKAA